MADDSDAVVDLDTSAEEQPVDDDDGVHPEQTDGGSDAAGDESFSPEPEAEDNELVQDSQEYGEADAGGGDSFDEGEQTKSPDAAASVEQSYEDPIAAQVREAIFMVFDSIDPDQPDDIFVKLAADVICKMVCSGTPATSVGVAVETEFGSLRFVSLAEKATEDTVHMASGIDRDLPQGSGVLHTCLSQHAVIAIPDVLEEPSVHFFAGSRRAGSLVAMPFVDESNTIRGVICMDTCAPAAAAAASDAPAESELALQAAELQAAADEAQADADNAAADPDATEEEKAAAAAAAEEAKQVAAEALAAAQAEAPAPVLGEEADTAAPAAAPATFSEDNISILEVMAHELSRAISMLRQRHSKSDAAAAHASGLPLDSTYGSEGIAPESPQPGDEAQSPDGEYTEDEIDADALAAYEEQEAAKEEMQIRLTEAMVQREQLLQHNNDLLKRVALYYHLKKNDEAASLPAEDAERSVSDKEQRYFQLLQKLVVISQESTRVSEHYDRIEREMQARLEEKKIAAASAAHDLQVLRDEAAKGTDGGHTGRAVPPKLLKQLVDKERELDTLLDEKRLVRHCFWFAFVWFLCFLTPLQSNLKLRHECKKLEQAIKKREEVSSELHMIDFEQLKIENQSLNEKIEERNEELLKLRKKTTSTVQVLTHLKEKLQFVQAENQVLKTELTGLEAELGQHRDAVTKVKFQRDQLRHENAKLKASARGVCVL